MLRRISTKLVLAVLLAVVLPFVAFAIFIDEQIAERLTRHVVQQALLGLVKDLAGQLDYFVFECRSDMEQWSNAPLASLALEEQLAESSWLAQASAGGATDDLPRIGQGTAWGPEVVARLARDEDSPGPNVLAAPLRTQLTRELDRYVDLKRVYDLVLLVGADGGLVACSTRHPVLEGQPPLSLPFLEYLFAYDFRVEDWFADALATGRFRPVDQHVSPLHLEFPHSGELDLDAAWDHHVGFAAPVRARGDGREVLGVLYGLVNWKHVQDLVATEVITDAFRGLVREDRDPSPYAWLWAEDANRILAHPQRDLYHLRITEDLGLPQLTAAVRDDDDGWGLYPEYRFQGELKNAAFRRCSPSLAYGFGWVVGVGIDNDDIFATADELRRVLFGGTAGVLAVVVLLTLLIARRTTGPIRALQQQVRRVAAGDLSARIRIDTRDELGALAEDFNRMTGELAAQRERIVKAEKDAAWREMARQIAHDIKNPLTPIKLSLDLLERARRERSPGSEEILERTMVLVRRQVENLRQIAAEFYEFTGGRKPQPAPVDAWPLLDEVLHLHDAWAVERGVVVHRDGPPAVLRADPGKLRRVLNNLVTNALQAMPEGGELFVSTAVEDGWVTLAVRDTGRGIAADARAHLFEPYFTTKTEGTGLGLAIAKRAVEDMGGTIELAAGPGSSGTVARVRLPRHAPGAA